MTVVAEKSRVSSQAQLTNDERITADAVRFQYRNVGVTLLGLLVFPAVSIIVLWDQISKPLLLGWGLVSYSVFLLRALLLRAYSRRNPPTHEAPRWGNYFAASTFIAGVVWGFAGIFFIVPNSTPHQVFILTVIIGLAAGSVITTSYWLPSFYAYALASVGLVIINMFSKGTPIWISLGALSSIFLLLVLRMGHVSNKNIRESIRLRFENLELIEKLREQKTQAEQANRAKTQFLASASHDLRQPVHALALFASALKYEVTSDKGQDIMEHLEKSIESIDELLSSLLDISKLDAGVVKVNAADIRLQSIFNQMRSEFQAQAERLNLEFRVRDTSLAVHSDPVLLTNVIRNLVSNALRYTRHGGVLLACRQRGPGVSIEIWDTGIGIPENEQQRIFNEFYQLNNPERDRSKGLGLGLAICQRLCALLKHALTLDSRVGKGSLFRIRAPLARSRPRSGAESRSADELLLNRKTILVIDDEKEILNAMSAILQAWKCRVLTASSAVEAVQVTRTAANPPDLIVCDYRLRNEEIGADAIHAVQKILKQPVPAIIMTGDTAPERIREAQASGYALLHKPVKPAQFYETLQNLLSGK
ncbi:MAG TPA: hybrid sensor histidine kinase/response regulator [Gammaproteobacteria bacterium]|nr:hybrid sensor histidine kinase/response regulator [Gammaproteobacteria bacterium]